MKSLQRAEYWDYVRLTAGGVTSLSFFNVPIGQLDPVSSAQKTMEETNLNKGGQLPYNFELRRIRTHVHVLPKTRQPTGISDQTNTITKWYRGLASAFADLCGAGVLSVFINSKEILTINQPFRKCPPGFGVNTNIQSNDTYNLFPQQPWDAPLYAVAPALPIRSTDLLQVSIAFPNTSPSFTNAVNSTSPRINIGVYLEGVADIPVG